MKVFIQRNPMEWRMVELGPFMFNNDKGVPNKVDNLTDSELTIVAYDGRAKNSLLTGLSAMKIDKVSACKIAKDIWDILELVNEGSTKVKRVKLSKLMQEYELFELEKGESIHEAQGRFIAIMNSLQMLGKSIPQSEINQKILKSMLLRIKNNTKQSNT